MTDRPAREEEIRARLGAATPGPWEPGDVWLTAGLIYSDAGDQVDNGEATRCAYCHLGPPSWSGRRDINGTVMPAHQHRSPDPYDVDHAISSAGGELIAYEGGGVLRREDIQFIAHAREDVPFLLAKDDALRQFRTWLADQVAKAEHADQITEERGGIRDDLKISPHNGLAAGLRTALLGLDQHLTQTKGTRP